MSLLPFFSLFSLPTTPSPPSPSPYSSSPVGADFVLIPTAMAALMLAQVLPAADDDVGHPLLVPLGLLSVSNGAVCML